MKYLIKDLFLFAQQKGGSKGFGKVTKGLMMLIIHAGRKRYLDGDTHREVVEAEPRTLVRKLEENDGKTKSTIY